MNNIGYRIVSRDGVTRIYDQDDVEIRYVQSVEIDHSAGDLPRAKITVLVNQLDIEVNKDNTELKGDN